MRILPALRKFNTVALAIGLSLAIGVLLYGIYQSYSVSKYEDEFASPANGNRSSDIGGQRIDAGDRVISLYSRGEPNAEAKFDLRFVDSRDGSSVRLGNDAQQEFYGGSVLGVPRRGQMDAGYGYLALAKTSERDGRPKFDLIFLRFSDMRKFTLASEIFAADETELDGKTFSAVVWNEQDRGKFLLFDSEAGKVVVTKDLDLQGKKVSEALPVAPPSHTFD